MSQMAGTTNNRAEGSLANSAYERIRAAILKGELRPNERLVETELAERLNVSRTPLRESLTRLASDGLVISRRRAWIVRDYTPQEISEIHEVRAALEGMAVYLAAERADDQQISHIERLHAKWETEAVSDRTQLVDYNDAFHNAIIDACGSERLRHFARLNREFFFTYRIARIYTDDQARESVHGHGDVVRALKARDGEAASRIMRDHILQARDEIIHLMH
jgi:DNA-binding GntR family transcriptional regulator